MKTTVLTQLGDKVSPQEPRAPKDGGDVPRDGAVSRRPLRNDGLVGRHDGQVVHPTLCGSEGVILSTLTASDRRKQAHHSRMPEGAL
jgi:hypothetical protein